MTNQTSKEGFDLHCVNLHPETQRRRGLAHAVWTNFGFAATERRGVYGRVHGGVDSNLMSDTRVETANGNGAFHLGKERRMNRYSLTRT
jgi:hypothetical protein